MWGEVAGGGGGDPKPRQEAETWRSAQGIIHISNSFYAAHKRHLFGILQRFIMCSRYFGWHLLGEQVVLDGRKCPCGTVDGRKCPCGTVVFFVYLIIGIL